MAWRITGHDLSTFFLTCLLLGTSAARSENASPPPEVATTEVAPGVYTFRHGFTRNMFMVTSEGVIATDPISPQSARLMRQEIAKVTDLPVKYVVYSHQHWDHVLGGQIFKDEGAVFISHKNCLAHFKRHPNPDLVMPDITFEGNDTLTLGDRTLELLYFGRNHGDCLVTMRPGGTSIMYIVDLVTPGRTSWATMPDYYPVDYIRSLKELEALDGFDQMIAGHGMIPLAPKSAVTERRAYMEALMRAVKKEIDKGTEFNRIADSVDLPAFRYLGGYEQNIAGNAERMVYYYTMGW